MPTQSLQQTQCVKSSAAPAVLRKRLVYPQEPLRQAREILGGLQRVLGIQRRTRAPRPLRHSPRHGLRKGCLGLALLVTPAASPVLAEEWTNLAGTATIEADFVGVWHGKVILQRPDGTRLSVDKANLQATSRLRVDDLVAEREAQLAQRIAELRDQPEEVTPIPPAQASVAYQEWPEAAEPQDVLRHVSEQFTGGHPRVLWDALPPSYQQDVQSLVRLFADEMDPEQYATGMGLGSQLAHVLYKQREFIFGYPKLAAVPPEIMERARAVFTPLLGITAELSDLEVLSLENLKNTDLEAIIAQKDESMGGYVEQLLKLAGAAEGPLQVSVQNPLAEAILQGEVTVAMEGEDRARLTWIGPPEPPSQGPAMGFGSMGPGSMAPGMGPGSGAPGMGPGSGAPGMGPGSGAPGMGSGSGAPGMGAGSGMGSGSPSGSGSTSASGAGGQGTERSLVLVRVEERWLPESMVTEWAAGVAQAREQLAGLSDRMAQSSGTITMLNLTLGPLLTRLDAVTTQEEFNAVIDPYVDLLLGAAMPSNRGGSGSYSPPGMGMPGIGMAPGMETDMEMEMEMETEMEMEP